VKGDLAASWQLLSSKSRSQITAPQWEEAFRAKPSSRLPSGNDLLRALASASEAPTVGDVLVDSGEALIVVSGAVRITQQLVLVKEAGAWLVDIAASDQINSREAARVFIDAVGAASPRAATMPVRIPETSLPMLRAMLIPEAKSYYLLDASVQADRAQLTLACDLPVSIVLRAVRSGPGWMVDLARPLVNTSPTSPDPLKEAADSNIQGACQDQLRQLARALQMYAAANGDIFPGPDRWLQQLKPFLGEGASLHCPADKTPGVSYAMNRNLAAKKRSQVGNPAATPLFYESTLHTANPVDTGESWPSPTIHTGGNMVLYADGSVRLTAGKPSFAVTQTDQPVAPERRPPQRRRLPATPQPQPR
jgi:prepilin-type processing-associated H-X9-DG protein